MRQLLRDRLQLITVYLDLPFVSKICAEIHQESYQKADIFYISIEDPGIISHVWFGAPGHSSPLGPFITCEVLPYIAVKRQLLVELHVFLMLLQLGRD